MRKNIKLNEQEKGFFTYEEILEKYNPYIRKLSSSYFNTFKKYQKVTNHIEYNDLLQLCKIGLYKAYVKYDINFFKDGTQIGFFTIMETECKNILSKELEQNIRNRRKEGSANDIFIQYIDEDISEDGKIKMKDTIVDPKNDFEEMFIKEEVNFLLSKLLDIERNIVIDLYFNEITQKEIAKKYKTSQAQISRINARALKKMKRIEGEIKMNVTKKVLFNDIKEFLINNVDNYKDITKALNAYVELNTFDITSHDVVQCLNGNKEYYEIEKLYQESKNNILKNKEIEKNYKEKNKRMKQNKIVTDENIELINLSATFNIDNFKFDFNNNKIKINNIPSDYMSIEEITALKNALDKAIRVNSNLNANMV